MNDELKVIDLGDATVETKQLPALQQPDSQEANGSRSLGL